MAAAELLLSDGVVAFFVVVGLSATSVSVLLQLSTVAIVCLTLLAELWMVLAWYALAASCETVWQLPGLMVNIVLSLTRAGVGIDLRGYRPRFPQWTVSLEFVCATVIAMRGGKYAYNLVRRRNAQYFRQQGDIIGSTKGTKSCEQFDMTVNPVVLNGLEHLWIRPKGETRNKTRLIDLGNQLRAAIVSKLQQLDAKQAENVTVEVLLANYRKSLEYQFPIPQQDALSMYKYLIEQEGVPADHVILGGDSAGGGLVMSTLLRIRDETNLPQPTAAILASPSLTLLRIYRLTRAMIGIAFSRSPCSMRSSMPSTQLHPTRKHGKTLPQCIATFAAFLLPTSRPVRAIPSIKTPSSSTQGPSRRSHDLGVRRF